MNNATHLSIQMDQVLEGVADRLVLQSPAGQKALRSAIRELSRWLLRQVKRTVAKSLKVRQKDLNSVFKNRVKTRVIEKELYADIWIGLGDIALIHLNAEQHAPGVVWADSHLRLGAFIANVYGGRQVYRRKYRGPGSTARSRQAIGSFRRAKGYLNAGPASLAGRFPLEKQSVPVYEEAMPALRKLQTQATEELQKRLIRRLDFYLNPPKRKRPKR